MNADRNALLASLEYAARLEKELALVRENNTTLYNSNMRLRARLNAVQNMAGEPRATVAHEASPQPHPVI
jgi:hypothetical protein